MLLCISRVDTQDDVDSNTAIVHVLTKKNEMCIAHLCNVLNVVAMAPFQQKGRRAAVILLLVQGVSKKTEFSVNWL